MVTIFCCQPFGIVSIVYASQVNSKYDAGDLTGAQRASSNAKQWMTWGLIAGLVTVVGVVILYGGIIFAALGGAM